MGRLSGKIALITGAGQGIGKATTVLFLKEGAQVIATDIDITKLNDIKNLDGVLEIAKLDVTSKENILELSNKISKIDIVFNCAGVVPVGSILECSESDWDATLNLNVKSAYLILQCLIPKIIENGTGCSIINMSSVASSLKGVPNRFAYSVSKGRRGGVRSEINDNFVNLTLSCYSFALIGLAFFCIPFMFFLVHFSADINPGMKFFQSESIWVNFGTGLCLGLGLGNSIIACGILALFFIISLTLIQNLLHDPPSTLNGVEFGSYFRSVQYISGFIFEIWEKWYRFVYYFGIMATITSYFMSIHYIRILPSYIIFIMTFGCSTLFMSSFYIYQNCLSVHAISQNLKSSVLKKVKNKENSRKITPFIHSIRPIFFQIGSGGEVKINHKGFCLEFLELHISKVTNLLIWSTTT